MHVILPDILTLNSTKTFIYPSPKRFDIRIRVKSIIKMTEIVEYDKFG